MGAAHATHHARAGTAGLPTHSVCPWTGGVDDGPRLHVVVTSGECVLSEQPMHSAIANLHLQQLAIVDGGCTSGSGFAQPFGYQSFGKFTLRVFVIEE